MRLKATKTSKFLRMQNLRRAVQVLAFFAFVYLFLLTIGRYDPSAQRIVLHSKAPIDTFFRIDPLLGLTTMIATRQIIHVMLYYALPVVILTILAGRFFCGWICPLGTAIDASDRLFVRKRKRNLTPDPSPGRRGGSFDLTPGPSPGRRGESSDLTPGPSPGRRGESSDLTPGPSPGRRGEGFDLTPDPSPGRRGESGAAQANHKSQISNLKYYILIGVLVAAVFSAQAAYFLDPITIITRAFTFAVFPIVQGAVSAAAGTDFARDHALFLSRNHYFPRDVQYFFRLDFLAVVVLVGILAMGSVSRRWWCRNLCPLGALLGVLSRFSILRRAVKTGCIHCNKCIPDCRTGAVTEDPAQYRAPECVYCYSCTSVCPVGVTSIAPSTAAEGFHGELDLNRRRTVQALGIGAAFALLGGKNVAAKTSRVGKVKVSSEALIRPPGAVPEDEFVDRCVRCSECMKVCPTNGLQPALAEAGILGLWTPVLVPRVGECTQNCNLCSQVCASQAIQPFEIKEKPHIFIGTAVIDRSQCIMWKMDKRHKTAACLVCDEHCSYHALYWEEVDGMQRPFVDEHKCVGCGICENACPIQPLAAVRVVSSGDKRHWTREQQEMFFRQSTVKPRPPSFEGQETVTGG